MSLTGTVPDPQFRLHKGSGRAYANVDGRRVYFGQYDDPAAREAYDRFIAEWKALGQRRPHDSAGELTIIELCGRRRQESRRLIIRHPQDLEISLPDCRRGKNTRHSILAMLRQSAYGRLV